MLHHSLRGNFVFFVALFCSLVELIALFVLLTYNYCLFALLMYEGGNKGSNFKAGAINCCHENKENSLRAYLLKWVQGGK